MSDVRVMVGDCRETLATLEAESIQCACTSPPYFGLRSYGIQPSVWGGEPNCEHVWTAPLPAKRQRWGGTSTLSKKQASNRGSRQNVAAFDRSMETEPLAFQAGNSITVDTGGQVPAGANIEHNRERSRLAEQAVMQPPCVKEETQRIGEVSTACAETSSASLVHASVAVEQSSNEVPNELIREVGHLSSKALPGDDTKFPQSANKRFTPDVPAEGGVSEPGDLFTDMGCRSNKLANEFNTAPVKTDEAYSARFPDVAIRNHQADEVGEVRGDCLKVLPVDRMPGDTPSVGSGLGRGSTFDGAERPLVSGIEVPCSSQELDTTMSASHLALGGPAGDRTTPSLSSPACPDLKGLAANTTVNHEHIAMICEKCGAVKCCLGNEPTVSLFVEHLVEVFRAVRRVLRDDGCLWVNLADSYVSSGGHTGHGANSAAAGRRRIKEGVANHSHGCTSGDLPPKNLCLVPARFALAMQADGWFVRSDVIWHKRSAMPQSVEDRPTPDHEYLFLFTRSARYFYDSLAVRAPYAEATLPQLGTRYTGTARKDYGSNGVQSPGDVKRRTIAGMEARGGANLRTVWSLTSEPWDPREVGMPEVQHFASFPPSLPRRCILLSTSEAGECAECGKPWQRRVHREAMQVRPGPGRIAKQAENGELCRTACGGTMTKPPMAETLGWQPTCSCPVAPPVPQRVLDPFCGSGTTLAVAVAHGRHAIGCDANPDYARLSEARARQAAGLFGAVPEAETVRETVRQLTLLEAGR